MCQFKFLKSHRDPVSLWWQVWKPHNQAKSSTLVDGDEGCGIGPSGKLLCFEQAKKIIHHFSIHVWLIQLFISFELHAEVELKKLVSFNYLFFINKSLTLTNMCHWILVKGLGGQIFPFSLLVQCKRTNNLLTTKQ